MGKVRTNTDVNLTSAKSSWMGSPILVSPNFGGSSNGPRLGNAKVHPLVAAGKEGSTFTSTRASAGGESLELSSTSRRVGVATYRLEWRILLGDPLSKVMMGVKLFPRKCEMTMAHDSNRDDVMAF